MAWKIYHFKSLTSTQDKAREFSKKGLSNVAVIADFQTKGRGRFKRKWHSGKGGLWMSILLKPENFDNLQHLTFAASIAVVKSIRKIANLKTRIKWPNDVHYRGKKLCGILTQGIFGRESYAIVGIGLNVNQKELPNAIEKTAASLRMIKHGFYDIKKIMRCIVDEFSVLYGYYNKNKLSKILKIWKKHCDTINQNVTVISKNGKSEGKAVGIGKDCSLLLSLKNKGIVKIIEGDVKIRY